jgi:predicted enzyme related to lactoylglutathione lyase
MRYPNGFPGWVDLSTTDPQAATAFYTALLGWTAQEMPTGTGSTYTMLSLDGRLVCGLGPQAPGTPEGVPPGWTTYVLVGDLDEVVAATPDAGGQVLLAAMDVLTSGRMAMVADPSGAALGLWQPRDHQGADVFNEPGAICWNELQSRDLGAALPFYEELFGWRWEHSDTPMGDYYVAHLDAKGSAAEGVDTSVAGAMPMPADVPDGVPSMWGVYVTAADLDDAVASATDLGATLVVPASDIGGDMRFATLSDPQGAVFSLMEMPDL